jgi:hypothetical protein
MGGSANAYEYVGAQPVTSFDLSGRCGDFVRDWWKFLNYAKSSGYGPPCGFSDRMHYTPIWRKTKAGYRWMRPDGSCSVPIVGARAGSGAFWDFNNACKTHDYLYDLMRFARLAGFLRRVLADFNFYTDMLQDCQGRGWFSVLEEPCNGVARVFYLAVAVNSDLQGYGVP